VNIDLPFLRSSLRAGRLLHFLRRGGKRQAPTGCFL
jgi:hypothetical protein